MVRSLLSIGSLIGIVGWLVLSYLPDEIFSPPVLTMGEQLDFGAILFILSAAFVIVSVLIIRSTWNSLFPVIARERAASSADPEETTSATFVQQSSRRKSSGHSPDSELSMGAPTMHVQHKAIFGLRLSTEIFWAVIPLVLTLSVILLSYYAWTLH